MTVFPAIEFLALFVAAPTLFVFTRHRIPAIPALWAVTAYCLWILLRDPHFDRRRLWSADGLWRSVPGILSLFAIVVVIGVLLVRRYKPEVFLAFPRSNPVLWGLVMVLYPLLSVYPQGIVYRTFLFDRYASLFGSGWGLVLASAAAFSYVHIVFRNSLAVGLTFLAGLLFAVRYWETGSLFITSFEHSLYGCAIFTIGLGRCLITARRRGCVDTDQPIFLRWTEWSFSINTCAYPSKSTSVVNTLISRLFATAQISMSVRETAIPVERQLL